MTTLRLGHFDSGRAPGSWRDYISRYHENTRAMHQDRFRDDRNGAWRRPVSRPGNPVAALQTQLRTLGYLPHGDIDGIFGYRTQAGVRLFQIYARHQGLLAAHEAADAVVGPKTRRALQAAAANGATCRWTRPTRGKIRRWPALIAAAQDLVEDQYANTHPELLDDTSDTRPPSLWTVHRAPVHLLALRRTSWAASLTDTGRRLNNDVFVLSTGGRDLCFFGSTDPDPTMSSNPNGAPFLVKGQHRYRFGFHRMRDGAEKSYRALRPARTGVRVIRDTDRDLRLSASDRLDPDPNRTINIHWSGRGTTNWSAGCQVIAGAVYLDDKQQAIDCWDHAAVSYGGLGRGDRGAYDVFMSLLSVVSPDITTAGEVPMTLLEEQDLDMLDPELRDLARNAFGLAARTVSARDAGLQSLLAHHAPELLHTSDQLA